MIDKFHVIKSLRPGAYFDLINDVVHWTDPVQAEPTEAEIQAEIVRLQTEYAATQYQRDRKPEYPSLADLADALYWSSKGDNTKLDSYYAACEAVKIKYPKPEAGN